MVVIEALMPDVSPELADGEALRIVLQNMSERPVVVHNRLGSEVLIRMLGRRYPTSRRKHGNDVEMVNDAMKRKIFMGFHACCIGEFRLAKSDDPIARMTAIAPPRE
jgi:hypothetical protein